MWPYIPTAWRESDGFLVSLTSQRNENVSTEQVASMFGSWGDQSRSLKKNENIFKEMKTPRCTNDFEILDGILQIAPIKF
jgi:hypothetical protein